MVMLLVVMMVLLGVVFRLVRLVSVVVLWLCICRLGMVVWMVGLLKRCLILCWK